MQCSGAVISGIGVYGSCAGDTAWMLSSTALVLFMTIPGLALYYSGMVRTTSVLSVVMQILSIACLMTLLWFAFGYSLAFAPVTPFRATSTPLFGDGTRLWLRGMKIDTVNSIAPNIPETVFCAYQLTFAIITPSLICGSFADRMKYWPMLLFMTFWHILVYCPLAHANWHPDGFLNQAGVLDFAGGNVVHISSGIAGLVSSIVLGKRVGFLKPETKRFSSILNTFVGASMLWVGWLGFNAGSAFAANGQAGIAILNTVISTAVAAITWMLTEFAVKTEHKPKLLGMSSGAIAGLVAITPCAGFVDANGAFWVGFFAGPVCYLGARIKRRCGYDDALDAFGVHAIGGSLGGVMVGLFASHALTPGQVLLDGRQKDGVFYAANPQDGFYQLGIQVYGIVVTGAWSALFSLVILLFVDNCVPGGLKVEPGDEDRLDETLHGESTFSVVVYDGGSTKQLRPGGGAERAGEEDDLGSKLRVERARARTGDTTATGEAEEEEGKGREEGVPSVSLFEQGVM